MLFYLLTWCVLKLSKCQTSPFSLVHKNDDDTIIKFTIEIIKAHPLIWQLGSIYRIFAFLHIYWLYSGSILILVIIIIFKRYENPTVIQRHHHAHMNIEWFMFIICSKIMKYYYVFWCIRVFNDDEDEDDNNACQLHHRKKKQRKRRCSLIIPTKS